MSTSEYFKQREEELMRLNAKLDEQKFKILSASEENIVPKAPEVNTTSKLSTPVLPMMVEGGSMMESLQSTVNYQKARIAALQEELDRVHTTSTAKDAELGSLRVALRESTEEVKKLIRKIAGLESEVDKTSKKTVSVESRAKLGEEELAQMKKEKEVDEGNIRKLENQIRVSEVKLSRVVEENERLRQIAKEHKNNDKDKIEKEQVDKLATDVKRLTKQRAELINAFKKQSKLVDVLKRQKTHIEASRLLNFTEDEFVKLLANSSSDRT